MQILLSFPFKPNGLSLFFFLTETAKWTIWICKNLNSVHEGSSSAEPACYANVAAYRLVGSLVASPSWPTSIVHSRRSLSPSSSSPHPFLHPHPGLICRRTLRCWGWGNGEVGCELAAEWQASPAPRNLREEHDQRSDKGRAHTRR